MNYEIKNDKITAVIETLGAQLVGVNICGEDIIWGRDPEVWGACAPVLFPIVGDLHNGEAIFDGEKYTLQKHGFARFLEYKCEVISESEVVFTLIPTAETLERYPFEFKLDVRYKIQEEKLTCTYEVTNNGEKPMPYCIGAHPAFKTNLKGASFETSYIQFEREEDFGAHRCGEGGLLKSLPCDCYGSGKKLPLLFDHFENDACIYKNINSKSVKIKNSVNDNEITVDFDGYANLGLWTFKGKRAEYICIEPWMGIPDEEGLGEIEFSQKNSCVLLRKGETHKTSFTISANIK